MYSSDGGTDPSKSDDDDIPISIHGSMSSPAKRTISDFTLYNFHYNLRDLELRNSISRQYRTWRYSLYY